MNPNPDVWGKYHIRRLIGEGGMAEIFEADMLGPAGFVKPVCIKRVRPLLSADKQFVQMFESEARIAAMLDHPNIVSVFDFDQHEGRLFLAMEYVDGLNLRELLNAAATVGLRLPPELAVYVLDSLLAALAHAHDRTVDGVPRAVIHRDVSPQNVLISKEGVVKLTDFGIAKAQGVGDVTTQQGIVKGKLSYMSPEQAGGKPVDPTSDLFSAGLVFYEILTGSRFFKGQDEAAIFARIHSFTPQPIPWASTAVNDLLGHLVVANRAERFQSAEAARNALRNVGITSQPTRDTAKLVTGIRAMVTRTEAKTSKTVPARADWESAHHATTSLPAPVFLKKRGKLVIALALLTAIFIGILIVGVSRRGARKADIGAAAAVPGSPPAMAKSLSVAAPSPPTSEDVQVLSDARPPIEPASPAAAAAADQGSPEPQWKPAGPRRKIPTPPSVNKRAPPAPSATQSGTLEVNVRPWASVAVDGVDHGTTPLRKLALTAGNHRVTLVNQQLGYSETVRIHIKPDEVETINKVIEK